VWFCMHAHMPLDMLTLSIRGQGVVIKIGYGTRVHPSQTKQSGKMNSKMQIRFTGNVVCVRQLRAMTDNPKRNMVYVRIFQLENIWCALTSKLERMSRPGTMTCLRI
jgi:hypothetical protein